MTINLGSVVAGDGTDQLTGESLSGVSALFRLQLRGESDAGYAAAKAAWEASMLRSALLTRAQVGA